MQSQQLRALTAAVNATQSTTPTISASPNTGISTVLATPLPRSLSTTSNVASQVGRGTKRENTTTASNNSKKSKVKKTND